MTVDYFSYNNERTLIRQPQTVTLDYLSNNNERTSTRLANGEGAAGLKALLGEHRRREPNVGQAGNHLGVTHCCHATVHILV